MYFFILMSFFVFFFIYNFICRAEISNEIELYKFFLISSVFNQSITWQQDEEKKTHDLCT